MEDCSRLSSIAAQQHKRGGELWTQKSTCVSSNSRSAVKRQTSCAHTPQGVSGSTVRCYILLCRSTRNDIQTIAVARSLDAQTKKVCQLNQMQQVPINPLPDVLGVFSSMRIPDVSFCARGSCCRRFACPFHKLGKGGDMSMPLLYCIAFA